MELKDTVELMNSADYKDRFRAEYMQLDIRAKRLLAMLDYMSNKGIKNLDKTPYDLLYAQLCAMCNYRDVLQERAKIEHIELGDY